MLRRTPPYSLALVLFGSLSPAQNGDRPGEPQPDLPVDLEIPASPALSVRESLDGFALPPGFRIECVASEPLVEDPVCMAFDGDGRIWVAEMLAYMPDVDGTGEDAPTGKIAILTDTDGDGVHDERTNFLEGLVLPRAVLPYRDGALVISPPELSFWRDTDGDGVADEREVIARGLGGLHSPEHAINALRWTHDNWIQCANHSLRFRETEEEGWITERTGGGGQWGLSLDEEGRAFFNTNSDPLRGDLFSSHYAVRNPNHGKIGGTNVRVAHDMQVWPSHITPGVNRGYREATLRDDFTLRTFTGACGPLVYLGGALPEEFRGNAFVPEPCGNLIKRYTLHPKGGLGLQARNAYEGRDFLTSTDERFRPVNCYDGPDGALYVVDMYRGLIQHRLFVTSWLRRQVEERGLAQPLGLGRIYRIVHEEMEEQEPPSMSEASWTNLVRELGHSNGWRRLKAQQLIVEDGVGDPDAIEVSRSAVTDSRSPLGRMHAVNALAGIGGLEVEVLKRALADADQRVARAALRAAEALLATGDEELHDAAAALLDAGDPRTRHQALLSIGQANTAQGDRLLADALFGSAGSKSDREAVISGLAHREAAFLEELFGREGWAEEAKGRVELVKALARCVVREGQSESLDDLFTLIVVTALEEDLSFKPSMGWRSSALIEGWMAGRPKGPKGEPVPVALASEPERIVSARYLCEYNATGALKEMMSWITWPGGPNAEGVEPVRPLTEAEQALFLRGREIYTNVCAACHQGSGLGDPGLAPPLRYSEWVLEDAVTLARIVVGGMTGPMKVRGKVWDMEMPVYDDSTEDVAAVLTYIRREWGHGAEPVTPEEVLAVVEELAQRGRPWTAEELLKAREEE